MAVSVGPFALWVNMIPLAGSYDSLYRSQLMQIPPLNSPTHLPQLGLPCPGHLFICACCSNYFWVKFLNCYTPCWLLQRGCAGFSAFFVDAHHTGCFINELARSKKKKKKWCPAWVRHCIAQGRWQLQANSG